MYKKFVGLLRYLTKVELNVFLYTHKVLISGKASGVGIICCRYWQNTTYIIYINQQIVSYEHTISKLVGISWYTSYTKKRALRKI